MWLCLLQVVSLSEDKMSVDLNSDDMLKWKELTQKKQQEYYDSPPIDRLRDCKQSDNSNLKKINAFGFSKTLTSTDKQTKHISKISGIVKKTIKNMEMRIFVFLFYLCWRRQEIITGNCL